VTTVLTWLGLVVDPTTVEFVVHVVVPPLPPVWVQDCVMVVGVDELIVVLVDVCVGLLL
jgi:hypothetical protein